MQSRIFISFLGAIFGVIIIGLAFLTLSYVVAAPTDTPPNGNPTFPLVGPTGATGSQGQQGIPGPQESFQCVLCFATCGGDFPNLGGAMAVDAFIGYDEFCVGAPVWNGNTSLGNQGGVRLCCR